MDKIKYGIEKKYVKELQELNLLDKLMLLDIDYTKYNDMISEKTEKLIEKMVSNKIHFSILLREIAVMETQEYNDLEDYEKEVINEEISEYLYDLIIDISQELN